MIDQAPPWLLTMRSISGTHEVQGDGDSQIILSWRDAIAKRFPEYAAYCRGYTHDSIAWCGLTVAYCMAANGIKPVKEFLWADNWRTFGTKLTVPRLGCVLTFKRTGGNHVALYERTEGQYYIIRGGNQSDAVNETRKLQSECTGMVWPATVQVPVQPPKPVTPPVATPGQKAGATGIVGLIGAAVYAGAQFGKEHPFEVLIGIAAVVALVFWIVRRMKAQ